MRIIMFFLSAVLCLLTGCSGSVSSESAMASRWEEVAALCRAQPNAAAREEALVEAGLGVALDVEEDLCYLTTGEAFREFLTQKAGSQEVFDVSAEGILDYRRFSFQEDTLWVYTFSRALDGSETPVDIAYPVLDYVLSDRGNFYYRVLPQGDKHYADYTLLRLAPPEEGLWAMTQTYLSPGSYMGSNLFLSDWSEGHWGELAFNDLWESFYYAATGQNATTDSYAGDGSQRLFHLPAREFEAIILPYFDLDRDTLRALAHYDSATDTYPWRPLIGDDFVEQLLYYRIQPEVTAYRNNGDGTLTLTVDALCTDLAQDRLFSHELTVRPLENGAFQYVSNRVTYLCDVGLPYCQPRLSWEIS